MRRRATFSGSFVALARGGLLRQLPVGVLLQTGSRAAQVLGRPQLVDALPAAQRGRMYSAQR